MDEYGTLKPVEVTFRRGQGRGRIMEGMNLGYNTCIYGNVTVSPLHIYHLLIKTLQKLFLRMKCPAHGKIPLQAAEVKGYLT
jgi:hypothetical protein